MRRNVPCDATSLNVNNHTAGVFAFSFSRGATGLVRDPLPRTARWPISSSERPFEFGMPLAVLKQFQVSAAQQKREVGNQEVISFSSAQHRGKFLLRLHPRSEYRTLHRN